MSLCWPLQMPPTPKAVLIALAYHANDEGECWPSIGRLAERTCFSERAVQNAIHWLEGAGALQTDRSSGRHTTYRVTPATFQTPAAAAPVPPQELHPTPAVPAPPTPAGDAGTPAPAAPLPVEPLSLRPPQEVPEPPHLLHPPPQEVPSKGQEQEPRARAKKKQTAAVNFNPPDWVPADAWAGYLEMRQRKKAPPTQRACELVVAELQKLRRLGHKPEDVLDQSTRNSWTDVYAIKPGATDANRQPSRKLSVVEQVQQHIDERDRNRDGGFVLEGEAVRVASR